LPRLPAVWDGAKPNPAFPQDLPNRPFRMDLPPVSVPLSGHTRDLIHKFYPQQEQINGGRNDRFVAVSDAGALAMGYYDGSPLPMWKVAQEFVLADRFFMAAFGDSYQPLLADLRVHAGDPDREPARATRWRGW
jgi:acid phosphatase